MIRPGTLMALAAMAAMALALWGCTNSGGPSGGGGGGNGGGGDTLRPPDNRIGAGGGDPAGNNPRVVTGVVPARIPRISDDEKARIIRESLIGLQRMIISSDEQIKLAAGAEKSTAGRDVLATKLAELGFTVVQTSAALAFSPSEAEQDGFRGENKCNLAFLLTGSAAQVDKLGNFFSFEAELKGKVLNLTTHQTIATKTILKRGKRALTEAQAAEDANKAAGSDLATYLTDEVARLWEATSLVKMRLVVHNLDTAAKADDLRVGLQRRVGVYYVSLERWDERSQTAEIEVLARFDVQRFMVGYVEELRKGGLDITRVEGAGETIKATRKTGG